MTMLRAVIMSVGVALVAVVGAGFWITTQLKPVKSTSADSIRFVIARGQSVIKTAESLEMAGLVRNATVFRYYAQFYKLDKEMQAGSYELSATMSVSQIAKELTQGSEDIWITLLEGWRNEEVAEYLDAQDLPEFDAASFIELAGTSQGMIYPDTYLVPQESTALQLYNLFINTFEKKVQKDLTSEITASGEDLEDIVILASIVEREGRGTQDMRHVAGILQNRLKIGMALQADATLQYIAGVDAKTKDWWNPPSIATKESTSPYNTYKYPGLPPGPISNPGLAAIRAVLDPVKSDDLFYIHTPSGEAYYAESLEEHNANINRYLR